MIWKTSLFKYNKCYYSIKEEAVNSARSLIRSGFWVKIKKIGEKGGR